MTRRFLFAAALVAAAPLALAATSARVGIGAPEVRLFDLNRNDSITPEFFQGGPRVDAFDTLRPAPVSPDAQGSAAITALDEQNVAGQTFGPRSSFLAVSDSYLPSFTLTVTGNTRVTVNTPYTMGWSVTREASFEGMLPGASTSAELALVAVNNFSFAELASRADYPGYSLLATRVASAQLVAPEDRMPRGSHERTGVLQVTFDNATAEPAVFAIRAEMVVAGHTADAGMPPPPVPEPTTLALSLAGVAGLVAARRLMRRD
jgi:hypothetical protein